MHRNALGTAVFAAFAFATAACGNGEDPDIVVIGPGEPVRIGTLLPGTVGSLRAAVEMAVGHFGPVHGHEVQLEPPVDSMCSPEAGRAGAEQIVAEPRVLGIVGTSCSASAVTASPVISAAGLVMVSPSNTSPVLTSDLEGNPGPDHHPGYFRVANNDLARGEAVAGFAYDGLGLRRMVTMHDGDPYTTALASAFEAAFTERGGEVPAVGAVEKGQTDMTDVLAEFVAAGPDGVFFPLFSDEATHFIKQARQLEGLAGVRYIGGDAAFTTEFLALPETERLYFAGPPAHLLDNRNVATGRTVSGVLAAFGAGHSEVAHSTPYWAHAYDSTVLLLAAIEWAAVRNDGNFLTRAIGLDEEGTLRISRSELRRAVREVSKSHDGGFPSLIGRLSCDEFGDCGPGTQSIYRHLDPSVTDPGELPVVYRFEP